MSLRNARSRPRRRSWRWRSRMGFPPRRSRSPPHPRQLGGRDPRARQAGRHLPQARPRSRHLVHAGGGETLQVVVSGSVDIGLSAGVLGSLGAYGKGAPIRIIGASSTGSRETFWWVAAKSLLRSMREVDGQTIAYSTSGASPISWCCASSANTASRQSRSRPGTRPPITQVMSGQVDVGWAVAPFVLDLLDKGEARMIARGDIAAVRQTIRYRSPTRRTWRPRRTPSRAT